MLKFLLCSLILYSSISSISTVKLTLLHFNDIFCQMKDFNKDNPSVGGNWGGLGPLIKLLDDNEGQNVFRLAAGNLVGGENGWLSMLGWERFGSLLDRFYKPSATGLGLKDFESGLNRTNSYLSQWKSDKALVSNVICDGFATDDKEEKLFCENHIQSFQILKLNGSGGVGSYEVGIVGFVNPLVTKLADPGKLKFDEDIPAALQKVINDKLSTVKTVIAVGSGNMNIAKSILDNVPKIKIVVLSGSTYQMTDYPEGYNNGLIVKAGSYGTTFGKLVVDINEGDGTVSKTSDSKLVDNVGTADTDAQKEVEEMNKVILEKDKPVGQTLVKLEGTREKCWKTECNLGNLVADSMVHCALNHPSLNTTDYLDLIAVWTSGSIFDDEVDPGKQFSVLDIHKWLPYHNRAYVVKIKGSTLKQIFQTSGGAIQAPDNGQKAWGQFLQVSNGIEVIYSTSGELKTLLVHHEDDSQPLLKAVEDDLEYTVALPSFMFLGRSVYDYLPGKFLNAPGQDFKLDIGFDDECLQNYTQALKVVSIGFEKRIFINDDDAGGSCQPCKGSNTGVTVFLTLLIFLLIVGTVYVGWKFVWPRFRQRGHTSHFP